MVMPFGKYRGVELQELPDDYLTWLTTIDLRPMLRAAVEQERARRVTSDVRSLDLLPEERSAAAKIIDAGRRAMAKTLHPDIGGDGIAMSIINATADKLRNQIGGTA